MSDLCTVQQVQAYLGTTVDAALLQSLVAAASVAAESIMGRTILQADYAERYHGSGNGQMPLRNAPITAVDGVTIGRQTIQPAADAVACGYEFDQDTVYLRGYLFCRGTRNVAIQYTAGFPDIVVTAEPLTVPANPGPYTAKLKGWLTLRSITSLRYAVGGVPLTRVDANPAVGQYALDYGVLTFNAADAGAALLCDYVTLGVPADIQQAVINMAAVMYNRRDRLDIRERILAQQTIAYDMSAVPSAANAVLLSYRRYGVPA